MARYTSTEQRKALINKCYSYLLDNFSKFSKTNKIKVALEIVKKSMPADINLQGDALNVNVYTILKEAQRDFAEGRMSSMVLDSGDGVDKG